MGDARNATRRIAASPRAISVAGCAITEILLRASARGAYCSSVTYLRIVFSDPMSTNRHQSHGHAVFVVCTQANDEVPFSRHVSRTVAPSRSHPPRKREVWLGGYADLPCKTSPGDRLEQETKYVSRRSRALSTYYTCDSLVSVG